MPTFDQVSQIPPVREGEVEPAFIDENGHMNISDYFRLTSHALWQDQRAAGFTDTYLTERQMSLFTVEQHIRYFGEMRLGQPFTVHNRFIARSARAVHAMAFVLDQDKRALACTMEATWVHVDMQSRRSVDLPEDLADGLDGLLSRDGQLDWPAPLIGGMGVRR